MRSIASSVGSGRNSLTLTRYTGPTLHAPRLTVPPGQLVGICGEVCCLSWLQPCSHSVPSAQNLPLAERIDAGAC
jgi:hypothetical protein